MAALKAQCPQCRKSLRYGVEEAGLPALCNACGTRFKLPGGSGVPDVDGLPGEQNRSIWRSALPWTCAGVAVLAMAAFALVSAKSMIVATPPAVSLHVAAKTSSIIVEKAADAPTRPPSPPAPRASGADPSPGMNPALSRPRDLYLALPPVRPLQLATGLTDQQISDAIRRSVAYLMDNMDQQTFQVRDREDDRSGYHAGLDALCVYALIMAGQTINDPRLGEHSPFITGCLDELKKLHIEGHAATYAHALRATALAALNRPEDRRTLQADADYLVSNANDGAYTYEPFTRGENIFFGRQWDNSNSQYGLLGVWVASEAGIAVTPGYWQAVQKHWVTCQEGDGQWPYRENDPRLSMTCAGLASLFVTQEHLRPSKPATSGQDMPTRALDRGLAWLESGDNCVDVPQNNWRGYTDYGVERVGLASGYKFFGAHDWYRDLAGQIVDDQENDGSFRGGDPLVNSAFCCLFLSRGSHPIIMNKLRYAGAWNARPDDLLHLAHYAGEQLERPLNWQIVPVDHAWQDWADAPVLYITGEADPRLTDAQEQGLKSFVDNGGMLLTVSTGESAEFSAWAAALARRLFPDYPMRPLTIKNDLFNVVMKLEKNPSATALSLRGVSNGARLLMVQSDTDLSQIWEMRNPADNTAFDLGLNLSIYASGKAELRNRLSSLYVPPIHARPLYTLNVARLRYDGNWDPEPSAWERFGRVFQSATSWGLNVADVDIADLKPRSAQVAVLTGTDTVSFTAAQVGAMQEFVKSGGVLMVDVCGGRERFGQSVENLLFPQAFPGNRARPMRGDHPLVSGGLPGMRDLSRPHVRQYAEQFPGFVPTLPGIFQFGYGHVIYSPLDLTSGLLGTGTWGINGYSAEYSIAFMQNVMLWTARGQKEIAN